MTRLTTLLLLAFIATRAWPASMSEAFTKGTNFGKSNNTATQANIKSGAAQRTLPHVSPSAPQATYFGSPGLGEPATATVNACARALLNPNAYDDQACQAVNFSQTNSAIRPQFTIHSGDPMMAKSRVILNDPAAIAGSITGTYSGCTTQTVKTPEVYETQVCTEYRTLEHYACSKTLTVSVSDDGLDCSNGTYLTGVTELFRRPYVYIGALCAEDIKFLWTYRFSECTGSDDPIYVTSTVPTSAPQRVIAHLPCGGTYYIEGSCPEGNCAYTVGLSKGGWLGRSFLDHDIPLTGFSYRRPARHFRTSDTWSNQCTALEARLP